MSTEKFSIQEDSQEIVIFLTDMALHVQEPRKPKSVMHSIMSAIQSKKPGRFYLKNAKDSTLKENEFQFSVEMPPEIQTRVDRAEKIGKKIRFVLPEGGLPVFPGKDTIEFMEAHKKKNSKLWQKISGK